MSLVTMYYPDGRTALVELEWVDDFTNQGLLLEAPAQGGGGKPPKDPDPGEGGGDDGKDKGETDDDDGNEGSGDGGNGDGGGENDGNGGQELDDGGDGTDGDGDESKEEDPIVTAIRQLDPDNKELWTKQGKPQVAAIEEVLGYDISAAQRDAAWELVSPGDT